VLFRSSYVPDPEFENGGGKVNHQNAKAALGRCGLAPRSAGRVDTGGPANILRKLRYGSFPAFSKNRVRSTITPLVSKNSQRVVALSRRKRNVELCHPVSINF